MASKALRGSDAFLRLRNKRRYWITGASISTVLLAAILIPQWLEIEAFFYPLPPIALQVCENLLWAFTTSTIFMIFENSVNGGGSLIELYREINSSVKQLPNEEFSHQFLLETHVPPGAARINFRGDLTNLSIGAIDKYAFISKWGEWITFERYEETLQKYRHYLEQWESGIQENRLYFLPKGISEQEIDTLLTAIHHFNATLSHFYGIAYRIGETWILSEDSTMNIRMESDQSISPSELDEQVSELLPAALIETDLHRVRHVPVHSDTGDTISTVTEIYLDLLGADPCFLYSPTLSSDITPATNSNVSHAALMQDSDTPLTSASSRALPQDLKNSAPIHLWLDDRFWKAPPEELLTPELLFGFMEQMQNLSARITHYNVKLHDELARARDISLNA